VRLPASGRPPGERESTTRATHLKLQVSEILRNSNELLPAPPNPWVGTRHFGVSRHVGVARLRRIPCNWQRRKEIGHPRVLPVLGMGSALALSRSVCSKGDRCVLRNQRDWKILAVLVFALILWPASRVFAQTGGPQTTPPPTPQQVAAAAQQNVVTC